MRCWNGVLLVAVFAAALQLDTAHAADDGVAKPAEAASVWPGFLSGDASQVDPDSIPLEWSPTKNIAWKTNVPGYGQSTPVVWGDVVFVTSVEGPMKDTYHLLALNLKDGSEIWRKSLANPFPVKSSVYVSRAAPTPAVDADRVYAFYESGDCVAYTHEGEQVWHRALGTEFGGPKNEFGLSASPAQNADHIFILWDDEGPSYLIALDKKTGETAWKSDRTSRTSWSSPSLLTLGGTPYVVVSSAGSVDGYDPKTGEKVWAVDGLGGNSSTTPLVVGNDSLIISASAGRGGENAEAASKTNMLLRITSPDGTGPKPEVAWRTKAQSSFSSPISYRGFVYWQNRAGVVYCLDAKTGEEKYAERLPDGGWATPFGVGDRIYFPGKNGVTTVLAAGPEFKILAENQLWDPNAVEPPADAGAGEDTPERRAAAAQFSKPVQYGAVAVDGSLIIRVGPTVHCLRDLTESANP